MEEITFPEIVEIDANEVQTVSGAGSRTCGWIRDSGGNVVGVACNGPGGGVIWF